MTDNRGRPSHDDLVAAVNLNGGSMSALDLLHYFESQGYKEREIQRAIQSALNLNILIVGSKLHLYKRGI
jgi:hypothetical protein